MKLTINQVTAYLRKCNFLPVWYTKPKFTGHNRPRMPYWGYEMEDDPKAMTKKIDAAVNHSVIIFIFD